MVCDGAILSCSGSTGGTSPLKIFPEINIFMNEKPIGVISNSKANINILSFGMCKLTSNPAVAGNKNNPVPCMPSSVSPWKDGVSYFLAGNEKAISDKSTCQCSYGGAISIDPNQVGQTFLGYSNGSGNSESGKDDENKKEEKNDDKKEKSKVLKGQDNETVDEKAESNGFLIKKGDKGEIVSEINLRLMGFGCGTPNDNYDDTTVIIVKQFKTDYMNQANADGTFVDMVTIEAIDKFAEEYPITDTEFNQMVCPCTSYKDKEPKILGDKCSGFGKGRNGVALTTIEYTDAQTNWKIAYNEAFNPYEHPGIHKGILWIFRATKLYLKKYGYSVEKISSGYRCWNNNYKNKRVSTNHMGKAIDIIVKKPGKTITGAGNYDYLRSLIFVPDMKAQIKWPNKNKISLEPSGPKLANDWIHLDIRTYEKKYLSDNYFTKNKDYIVKPPKLKSLIK